MGSQIGFIIVFAVVGLAISAACGLIVGNRIGHIIFVSSMGMLSFMGLGFGIYKVIESRVPEFLDLISNLRGSYAEGEGEFGGIGGRDSGIPFEPGAGLGDEYGNRADIPQPVQKRKNEKFGDHLIVDNIEIKNEPKLMAEAIRTMLAKDEEA